MLSPLAASFPCAPRRHQPGRNEVLRPTSNTAARPLTRPFRLVPRPGCASLLPTQARISRLTHCVLNRVGVPDLYRPCNSKPRPPSPVCLPRKPQSRLRISDRRISSRRKRPRAARGRSLRRRNHLQTRQGCQEIKRPCANRGRVGASLGCLRRAADSTRILHRRVDQFFV